MEIVDTILDARWVIPVDESNRVLDNHSVIIHDGKICEILPSRDVNDLYSATIRSQYPDHALIPGFVNAHTHAAMTLLRGTADDYPLAEWLQQRIWPLEAKFVDAEFVRDGTLLAFAEMIRSGTTCANDMYLFPESVGEIAEKVSMRVCLGMIAIDFPTRWASTIDEYLTKDLALHDQYRNSELVTTMLAPHAPYTVSDNTIERLVQLADEHNFGIHMHIHETAQEVEDSIQQYGFRQIERLHRLGVIDSRLTAVHCTHLLDEEIQMFAEAGTSVVHCPKSNLKLASGISPVDKLLNAGVNVAVGTDGAASNNSLNMLEEMRFASLLAKGSSGDATAVDVHKALRMATVNGAKALGMDDRIGTLQPGKLADITAIDLSTRHSGPVFDPVSQIVNAASRDQVTDLWIGGRQMLRDCNLTSIDEEECDAISNQWHRRISENSQ